MPTPGAFFGQVVTMRQAKRSCAMAGAASGAGIPRQAGAALPYQAATVHLASLLEPARGRLTPGAL